jgi:hypothetical protein
MGYALSADMRALVLSSSVAVLAGCFDIGGDLEFDLGLDFGECFLGEPCVTAAHPFQFLEQTPRAIALEGEANVEYLAHDTLVGFDIVSLDPKVVSIEKNRGVFVIRPVAVGVTAIAARTAEGATLETIAIRVAKIASVGFAFAPAGDSPLPRLAALSGAKERIRVLPRDSNGEVLGGADRAVALGFTGGLARIDPGAAQVRVGEFKLFGATEKLGFEIGVEFGAVGGGSVAASVAGVEVGALPVEVIAAASEVALRVNGRAEISSVLVVSLVGSDADGAPVAGLVGDFAATPPELVTVYSPTARGEVFVIIGATPGLVTLSATLPDRVVSTAITIAPRP